MSNVGPTESIAKSDLISECGTYFGGPAPFGSGLPPSVYNAVSESGTAVFFTALGRDYPGCAELGSGVVMPAVNELYARLDASRSDAHTVAISEPSEADCKKCELSERADAIFEGASFDGSRAFFATTQHLLPGSGSGMELYMYDFNGPAGGRVTLVSGGDPVGARVQHVVRVSDDGSHVYFLAQGKLTTVPNAFGKHAESGAENLYVYEHDGAFPQGHIAFIGQGAVSVAQTTSDGRFLIFTSAADLTPDEEERVEAGQVFEYDTQSGVLIRVSRGQNGYNEDGNSEVYPAMIPDRTSRLDLPIEKSTRLAMSADGAYVFFTSEDALTPQALSGVMNVYEYHAGRLGLVSDGHDLVSVFGHPAVELLGTDESGRDVFFETADQLVPQDTDTQLDVYDARIEGGFPAAATTPGCSGDSCQGPLASGLPLTASPTSSSGGESAVPPVSGRALKGKRTSKRLTKHVKKHQKAHTHRAKKAAGGWR
ncbi:MAG TPA: hypothetical protein VGY76_00060 [Solirubrobacteraceae bacterium]|nr:hypothetical protein [Solirubrobacteraceae bacterium]